MKPSVNRYEKIKSAARNLMLAGNVDRYMQALRIMNGLRAQRTSGLA